MVLPVEPHRTERIGWLRAAVLGANDGIISIASLMVGVAAAASSNRDVIVAGVAGTVAGAISMAAGEYVSVSSQSDTEQAELARERKELAENPEFELEELSRIYVARGLDPELANRVAIQLTANNALEAHARDELGLSEVLSARPFQAAYASAISFALGAVLPLLVAMITPSAMAPAAISGVSLICLVALGGFSAAIGGAPPARAAFRVAFWGALAMGLTAGAGWVFGLAV
jgi:VIT1/CCC1 family predicted Fe2+/Mn2+ transporter